MSGWKWFWRAFGVYRWGRMIVGDVNRAGRRAKRRREMMERMAEQEAAREQRAEHAVEMATERGRQVREVEEWRGGEVKLPPKIEFGPYREGHKRPVVIKCGDGIRTFENYEGAIRWIEERYGIPAENWTINGKCYDAPAVEPLPVPAGEMSVWRAFAKGVAKGMGFAKPNAGVWTMAVLGVIAMAVICYFAYAVFGWIGVVACIGVIWYGTRHSNT